MWRFELDGDNELKSGTQSAGLEKNLHRYADPEGDSKEAGSLTATGGNNAAGIGGGFQGNGETSPSPAARVTRVPVDFRLRRRVGRP